MRKYHTLHLIMLLKIESEERKKHLECSLILSVANKMIMCDIMATYRWVDKRIENKYIRTKNLSTIT